MTETAMTDAPAARAPGELRLSRTFAAPRELVFEAFTKEEHLLEWWGPRDYPVAEFVSDPRQGGEFSLCMIGPNGEKARCEGEYEELTPPERIVTISRIPYEGRIVFEMRTTVVLKEYDGYTRLTVDTEVLRNHDFPGAAGAVEGWSQQLDKLTEYLATR